jgi:hypothetical protein
MLAPISLPSVPALLKGLPPASAQAEVEKLPALQLAASTKPTDVNVVGKQLAEPQV